MLMTPKEAEAQAGCWIAGHRGMYGVTDLINTARRRGFDVSDDDSLAIERYTSSTEVAHESDGDTVLWLADKAEGYLNDEVAPEGWSFGWADGEFFLRSAADWEVE